MQRNLRIDDPVLDDAIQAFRYHGLDVLAEKLMGWACLQGYGGPTGGCLDGLSANTWRNRAIRAETSLARNMELEEKWAGTAGQTASLNDRTFAITLTASAFEDDDIPVDFRYTTDLDGCPDSEGVDESSWINGNLTLMLNGLFRVLKNRHRLDQTDIEFTVNVDF